MNKFFALVMTGLLGLSANGQEEKDSVMYARDSVIELETDPTTLFFQQAEKTKSPGKLTLVTKSKKTVTLKKFIAGLNGDLADAPLYADHAFSDLDNDGKKELLIWNYTGGAHCCDEIYIFRNASANKYQQTAKLFGGHTMIMEDRIFQFSLNEYFGYFFTCYACGYGDTTDAAPIDVSSVALKYKNGRLQIIPGDKELKSIIYDNLGKLGEQPYEKLADVTDFDNGLRKEFAFNLAAYYYAFGKNLIETQKLFNKYYKFPDAKKVWSAFAKNLAALKADNDF
ncbi:MAG TPA: hypothetical protein PKA77_04375 [Chitinophagaceae bacterium]|nr:hypothetical protein [Chitinophagaceae bacterium]HMU57982.1 hypothetical protein [Chitinophagaceae bacterium]